MDQLCDDDAAGLTVHDSDLALTFRVVTDVGGLEAWRESWNALAGRAGGIAYPFLRAEWVEACLRSGDAKTRPVILMGFRRGDLEILWPLARRGKLPGRRRLFFAGSGPSDYQSLLVREAKPEALQAGLSALLEDVEWDRFDLYPLVEEEARRYTACWKSREDVRVTSDRVGLSPQLTVVNGWETKVHRRVRQDVEYQVRRLRRLGPLELRQATDNRSFDELLSGLCDLHVRRWALTRTPSQLVRPGIKERYRVLADAWRQAGVLDLRGLYVGDQLIAAHLGACTAERFYYHTPAFDPAYGTYSPGKVLLWKLLEDCGARGVPVFDFLRGGEVYKRDWGVTEEVGYWRLRVYRCRMWSGALINMMERTEQFLTRHPNIRHTARRLKRFLGE